MAISSEEQEAVWDMGNNSFQITKKTAKSRGVLSTDRTPQLYMEHKNNSRHFLENVDNDVHIAQSLRRFLLCSKRSLVWAVPKADMSSAAPWPGEMWK